MTRSVKASSGDGPQLRQLAEEIARLLNPACWYDLRDVDTRRAEYRADLQTLLNDQARLLRCPTAQGPCGRG